MMKSPVTIIFLGAASVANASPPILPPPPAPPPPILTSSYARADPALVAQERRRITTFDIVVRGGKEVIWTGSLRTSANGSGSFNQSKNEPPELCPDFDSMRYGTRSHELRVSVSSRYGGGEGVVNSFGLSVNWTRPVNNCGDGQGNRSVAFDQQFAIEPGGTRVLTGDGGLEVTVTRRR